MRPVGVAEPGQSTTAEAQRVAEEKENDCSENTGAIKEKEEGKGVAEPVAKKENESVAYSVSEKIAVTNPCSAVGGAASAAPDPNAFSHAARYSSANDCERHHSTGRS